MKRLHLLIWALFVFGPTCGRDDKCRGPCGRRPKAPGHSGPVQTEGSSSTLPGTWPWLVSIQVPEEEDFRHWCAGVLVTSRWVLTAAHCFVLNRYIKMKLWRIVVGVNQLSLPGPNAQVRSIERLVEHENYNIIGYLNDVALVELDEPVDCNDYVQLACLPDNSVTVPALSHCYFSGYRTFDAKNIFKKADILQEVKVDLLETMVCNSISGYYKRIKENNLCAMAEKGGKGICRSDGGGPLMCKEGQSERFWVVGIKSWGNGCTTSRTPEVFVTIKPFFSWIQRIIKGDGRPPPKLTTPPRPKWTPSPARPTPVSSPTGWFRPTALPPPKWTPSSARPSLSFARPNYVAGPPPNWQLPTRRPTGSVNGWNQGLSRPPLKPWFRPQPPRPPLKPQQFQNGTTGWPNTIVRRPRPRPPSKWQNQGGARSKL